MSEKVYGADVVWAWGSEGTKRKAMVTWARTHVAMAFFVIDVRGEKVRRR
ncbi:MAG: hypothetical protein HPY78_06325 [Brevinematales bacterium]|nr:hypothetical protein [Brevinematales bacterium]